jgi:hypothetical protein
MERTDETLNENRGNDKFKTDRKGSAATATPTGKATASSTATGKATASSAATAKATASSAATGKSASTGNNAAWQRWTRGWRSGTTATYLGGLLALLCGFVTVATFADSISYLSFEPLWLLEDVLPPFMLTGFGAGLFTWGHFRRKLVKRFRRYQNLIGEQQEISIPLLSKAYPARPEQVRSDLKRMVEAGLLGKKAYLDYSRDVLVVSGAGVQQPPQPEPKKATAPETDIGEENALLRQIREVNDAIRHPELSRKIDRIGEITERILEFQREHPDKSAELRKFLNYYLPTTLRILNSYAELEKQGIEGENIATTKKRIEDMMDMVVEGFERQLDKLFAGDMMDIAADITVMEQMMQGDGLVEDRDDGLGAH